jgi:hypothetical protein
MSQPAEVAAWLERPTPEQRTQIRWCADRVPAAGRFAGATRLVRAPIAHQTDPPIAHQTDL